VTWVSEHPKQFSGALLSATSLGLLAWLAYRGSSSEPPNTSQAALLAFASAVLQLAATWMFSQSGKPDDAVVRLASQHLVDMRNDAIEAEQAAEAAFKSSAPGDAHDVLGRLSVQVSTLRKGVEQQGRHWAVFHPTARKLLEGEQTDE
jgi:hypothetical protein